jgi:hypothetical protein
MTSTAERQPLLSASVDDERRGGEGEPGAVQAPRSELRLLLSLTLDSVPGARTRSYSRLALMNN